MGHGVHVSAVALDCSRAGDLKRVSKYEANTAFHALPVVSVVCAAAGIFTATCDSSYRNVSVLSMDSSGHGVVWQLPVLRKKESTGTLYPERLCSFVPSSWQNWLTPVEQGALRLDARIVRATAREREARRGNSLFSGLALSPSHCMLALQSMSVWEKTTQQRVVTYLLVTPVGRPMHAFNGMLRHLVNSLQQGQESFYQCCLWDVAESWQIQTHRKGFLKAGGP